MNSKALILTILGRKFQIKKKFQESKEMLTLRLSKN